MTRTVAFVVPGDIRTRTGGYEYDRRVIEGLSARGWTVRLRQLGEGFPSPGAAARTRAAAELRDLPDDSLVVIDGLALGALPDEVSAHASRLRIVALVHHPLALETGIAAEESARLRDSERRALSVVRHVVVTSEATSRTLVDYGVSGSRVSVAVPGTDVAELAAGSGGPEVSLLCVASLIPRKGHALLLGALAGLHALPWHLVCGGSGERDVATARALAAQVSAEGLDGRVEFAGELSAEALAREYHRADVFVLPTLYEGYGMAVAEALAHGLPVVATDTGGIAALVGDGAGIVCPPGDAASLSAALRRIVGNPDERERMASGARSVREHLPSWDDAALAMEAALLRVGGI